MLKIVKPRILSDGEKRDLCACAAKTAARTLRFDYAIHTASFRIIEPGRSAAKMLEVETCNQCTAICNWFDRLRRSQSRQQSDDCSRFYPAFAESLDTQ